MDANLTSGTDIAQPAAPATAVPPSAPAPPGPDPLEAEPGAWEQMLEFKVVLQLQSGESVELGAFAGHAEADACARDVIARMSQTTDWPCVRGRYLRPDVIVAVEVQQTRQHRWTGSALRRDWATPA